MEKKSKLTWCLPQKCRKRLIRFSLLLTLLFSCIIQAGAIAQQMTIRIEPGTLDEAFQQIIRQSDLQLVYNTGVAAEVRCAGAEFVNKEVGEILEALLSGTGLTYKFENGIYMINRKSAPAMQQPWQKTVSGKVTDEKGQPLTGATVIVKGTTLGVATDAEGRYTINIPADVTTLEVSFLGYKKAEVAIGNRTEINIRLEPDTQVIEDVVVTGYQTISRERSTGSFDMLSKKALDKPSTSISQRLIGTVAGVDASLDSEGNPSFIIRGQGTFLGSSPLVVVDGFVITGGFSSINPNDVESVTILKDAAAASIWGARASNGVIVVTTKKAKKQTEQDGKGLDVQFSALVKIGSKTDVGYLRNMASAGETIEWEKATFGKYGYQALASTVSNSDFKNAYNRVYTQAQTLYNRYVNHEISETDMNRELDRLSRSDNTGQIEKALLRRPVIQQYNLSFSGATKRMDNYVSILYSREISRYQGSDDNDIQFDYRGKMGLAKWLDLNVSTMFQYGKNNSGKLDAATIRKLGPYDMLFNEDGSYADLSYTKFYRPMIEAMVPKENFPYSDWSYNPIQEMENTDAQTTTFQVRAQAGLTLRLIEGLTLESKYQYEVYQYENRTLYNEQTYLVRNTVNTASTWDRGTGEVTANLPVGDILDQSKTTINAYNFRNQVNFNRSFAVKHAVNFIAGVEISQKRTKKYIYPRTYGYDDKHLTVGRFPNGTGDGREKLRDWLGSAEAFDYINQFSWQTDRYFSVYGNVAYTYDDKYTVSGSVRTDASNFITDDPSYRYSPFWSLGVAWNITREHFMERFQAVDYLKLRATYGFNGNSDNSTSVKPLISMEGYNAQSGELEASVASKGNPTLRWERTGVFNLGADFAFWNNRLFGKADYYRKYGKDILSDISIPMVNGATSATFNNAEIVNNGLEFEIGSRQTIAKNLTWEGSITFAYNHNKVKKLLRTSAPYWWLVGSGGYMYVEGKPINALYSYRYGGVQNIGTETDPKRVPVILLPDGEVMPINGSTTRDGLEFCEYQGNKVAPYVLGMSHTFSYRNFDLSLVLTGKFGHVFRRTAFNYPGRGEFPNKLLSEVMHADPDKIIPLPERETDEMWSSAMTGYQNYLTVSANNVRLQELTLSYSLPQTLLTKIGLNRATIYVQGNNLFTIKSIDEDPEFLYGTIRLLPACTFGLRVGF